MINTCMTVLDADNSNYNYNYNYNYNSLSPLIAITIPLAL